MFGWLFDRVTSPNSSNSYTLFEDSFLITEYPETESRKYNTELNRIGDVRLYSNKSHASKWKIYYEVTYTKKDNVRYLVYHTFSKENAQEMFDSVQVTLNALDRWLSSKKEVLSAQLRSIMESFRLNRKWTTAHVAAHLGTFDDYFIQRCPPEELNVQVEPDLETPLHLAIKAKAAETVRAILTNNKINLASVTAKRHSVVHYAAMANAKIASMVLAIEGVFHCLSWKDSKGCTALHLACFTHNFEIVYEFLLFGLTVQMLTLSAPKPPGENSPSPSQTSLNSNSSHPKQTVVQFSEQDLEDLDCQEMVHAGSPLHWAKLKRLVEKLLKYHFPINSVNLQGETALIVASRRQRLKCVISLLCAGCDVNLATNSGNTALHWAVKESDLVVSQTLIVFDADINQKNHAHESVRHEAAKHRKGEHNEAILYLLSALGAKRCPPKNNNGHDKHEKMAHISNETGHHHKESHCTQGCSANGDFEGSVSDQLYGLDQKYDRLFKNFLFDDIIKANASRSPEEMAAERCVNMLCLDGGGIKGLISVQMLKEVEKYLKHPLHHYFKWFAGTSTGSFISTFLAMGQSVDKIRATYFRFKDVVLNGEKPYSSKCLESVICESIGTQVKMEDVLSKHGNYLIIPTVIANRRPMKLHKFQSFPSAKELLEESGHKHLIEDTLPDHDKDLKNQTKYESRKIEVWKACRASGAAPIYFRAYQNFLDGGLISNNPTLDALTEFEQYNAALRAIGKSDKCQKLNLVLSIGTGRSPPEESDMVDIDKVYSLSSIPKILNMILKLVYEACQTEQHVVERAEAFCNAAKVPYFRCNASVSDLMELDEQQDCKIVNCLWETKLFMHYRREQVKKLAEYLERCTPIVSSNKSPHKRKTSKQSLHSAQTSGTSPTSLGNSLQLKRTATSKISFKSKPLVASKTSGIGKKEGRRKTN